MFNPARSESSFWNCIFVSPAICLLFLNYSFRSLLIWENKRKEKLLCVCTSESIPKWLDDLCFSFLFLMLFHACLFYAPFPSELLGSEESGIFPIHFLLGQLLKCFLWTFYQYILLVLLHGEVVCSLASILYGDVLHSWSLINCPVWPLWWTIQAHVTWFRLCN